jgi:hypothetical protein
MPRGRAWGVYVSDSGAEYSVHLDADYYADPDRWWAAVPDPPPPRLPKLFKPRRVLGVDDEGRIGRAIIPRVDSPLWTGEVTSFTFYASDQVPHSARIINRNSEWNPVNVHS